jgi:hypothetical protein
MVGSIFRKDPSYALMGHARSPFNIRSGQDNFRLSLYKKYGEWEYDNLKKVVLACLMR